MDSTDLRQRNKLKQNNQAELSTTTRTKNTGEDESNWSVGKVLMSCSCHLFRFGPFNYINNLTERIGKNLGEWKSLDQSRKIKYSKKLCDFLWLYYFGFFW